MYFGTDFEIINNASTLYVFAGNLRIAKMTDTGTEYYHKDHLGSTNAISGADGIVLATGEYLPYGSDRPQSINRYAYCLNNPLIYTDPTGHYDMGAGGAESNGNNGNNFGGFDRGYDRGPDGNHGTSGPFGGNPGIGEQDCLCQGGIYGKTENDDGIYSDGRCYGVNPSTNKGPIGPDNSRGGGEGPQLAEMFNLKKFLDLNPNAIETQYSKVYQKADRIQNFITNWLLGHFAKVATPQSVLGLFGKISSGVIGAVTAEGRFPSPTGGSSKKGYGSGTSFEDEFSYHNRNDSCIKQVQDLRKCLDE